MHGRLRQILRILAGAVRQDRVDLKGVNAPGGRPKCARIAV